MYVLAFGICWERSTQWWLLATSPLMNWWSKYHRLSQSISFLWLVGPDTLIKDNGGKWGSQLPHILSRRCLNELMKRIPQPLQINSTSLFTMYYSPKRTTQSFPFYPFSFSTFFRFISILFSSCPPLPVWRRNLHVELYPSEFSSFLVKIARKNHAYIILERLTSTNECRWEHY